MRTYYLFLIQEEYYQIYKKNLFVLYKILQNLSLLKAYDFAYGISIYRQLCYPFAVKLLNHYIRGKYPYKKINRRIIQLDSRIENTFVELNPSTIIVKSDCNYPEIFRTFHIYNKHIFVCDFDHEDYFWLSDQFTK